LKKKLFTSIVFAVLILASLEFVNRLVFHPFLIFRDLFITAVIVGVIFLAYHFLSTMSKNKEQRAFLKAARQSRKRLKKQGKTAKTVYRAQKAIRSRSTAHLTVIEGRKGKKLSRLAR